MTHTKDEALEALILKTGMNPVMQGSCYVMHPEALQAVIDGAIKQALAAPVQPVQEPCGRLESDPNEGHIFVPRIEGDWSMLGEDLYTKPPATQPAVQEPVLKPLSKKWKWVLHESFADVAGFDEEGIPSFYWKESVTKFKNGELSAPCKGKNCGSLNGWLHSSECRAEHEAQYTTPPAAQPAPVQGPITWLKTIETLGGFGKFVEAKPNEKGAKPVYLAPPAQPAPVQESVGTYGEIYESMLSLLRTGLQRDQQIYMEMKDKPLYTTPPAAQRQWVGLSQDELDAMFSNTIKGKKLVNWVARAIEAKLKEKNNG